MPSLNEAGLLDRALLHREIEAIFENTSGQESSVREAGGNFPDREIVEDYMEMLVRAALRGDVPPAAERVMALLSLELDDLRKAALLSLMVRLTGRQKFDPVAAYVLEKRMTYATGQG